MSLAINMTFIAATMQVLIFVMFMKKRSHDITCCLVLMDCTLMLELHGVLVNSSIGKAKKYQAVL
jgi:hypothetical protein